MKPAAISIFGIMFMILLASCKSTSSTKLLNTDSIATQVFEISIGKDTTLKTANGAFIRIPTGAFSSDDKKTIQLILKEAYDPQSMLNGGLSTKSDEGILSSAGMFYISCKDSASYSFNAPIEFSIPTVEVNPDMKLYKGALTADGSMIWKEERDSTAKVSGMTSDIAKGKELFEGNCKSCHAIGKVKVGPDLRHIGKLRDSIWLKKFVRNSAKLIKIEKDSLANLLYCQYNMTEMTAFPSFTDPEINNIFAYIDHYSYVNKLALPVADAKACLDSCKLYETQVEKLHQRKDKLLKIREQKRAIKTDANTFQRTIPTSTAQSTPGTTFIPANNTGEYLNYKPRYYKVAVQAYGWYNLDRLLKSFPEVRECNLEVELNGESIENSLSYLVIPDYNVVTQGVKTQNNKIGFDASNGNINLPIGRKAIIIVTKEEQKNVLFSIHELTIQETNKIQVSLKSVSPKEANNQIKNLKLKDFSYQINKRQSPKENSVLDKKINELTERVQEIDAAIQKLDYLKPKQCFCDCGDDNLSVNRDSSSSVNSSTIRKSLPRF